MRIYTLWENPPNEREMPWLVAATDEYAIESLGGDFPDYYKLEQRSPLPRRELVINIPEEVVMRLFRTPEVKGKAE